MVSIRRRRRLLAPLAAPLPAEPPARITGPAPDGSVTTVDLATGRHVLLFLTSSCRPCREVWASLPADPGIVVVTPGPSTESRRKVAELAPPTTTVVMSSEAWFAFSAGPAPWRVVVDGGRVVSAGSGQPGAHGVDGADDG